MSRTPVPDGTDNFDDGAIIALVDEVDSDDEVSGSSLRPRGATSGRLDAVDPEIDRGVDAALDRITGNHAVVASDDESDRPVEHVRTHRPPDSPEAALEGMFESFYGSRNVPSDAADVAAIADHSLAHVSGNGADFDYMDVETAPPKFRQTETDGHVPVASAIMREYFGGEQDAIPGDTLVDGLPNAQEMMDAFVPAGTEPGLAVTQPPTEERYEYREPQASVRRQGRARAAPVNAERQLAQGTEDLLRDYLASSPPPRRRRSPRRRRAARPPKRRLKMSTEELLAAYVSDSLPGDANPAPPTPAEPEVPPLPPTPPPIQAVTEPAAERPRDGHGGDVTMPLLPTPPPSRHVPGLPPDQGGQGRPVPGAPAGPPPLSTLPPLGGSVSPPPAAQPTLRPAPGPAPEHSASGSPPMPPAAASPGPAPGPAAPGTPPVRPSPRPTPQPAPRQPRDARSTSGVHRTPRRRSSGARIIERTSGVSSDEDARRSGGYYTTRTSLNDSDGDKPPTGGAPRAVSDAFKSTISPEDEKARPPGVPPFPIGRGPTPHGVGHDDVTPVPGEHEAVDTVELHEDFSSDVLRAIAADRRRRDSTSRSGNPSSDSSSQF